MGQLGFGLAAKIKLKMSSKKSESGSNRKGSSSYQKSFNNSPLMSPKASKTNQKKSRFAPGANIFEDPSPLGKNHPNKKFSLKDIKDKSNTLDFDANKAAISREVQTPKAQNFQPNKISNFKILVNNTETNGQDLSNKKMSQVKKSESKSIASDQNSAN